MSIINIIVGERIRTLRNKQNLSQEKLAEKAGLHNTYIGQVERGEKNVTIESLEKIINALEITFEELFKNMKSDNASGSISTDCYNMILKLSNEEQICIKDIIKRIMDFKELD